MIDIFRSRCSARMKSQRILAGSTGSSYPITSAEGPLRYGLTSTSAVPSTARTAMVFFSTGYSAWTPRNCRRSSDTWLTGSPEHSVKIATLARVSFSCSSETTAPFSSGVISLLSSGPPSAGDHPATQTDPLFEHRCLHPAPGASSPLGSLAP